MMHRCKTDVRADKRMQRVLCLVLFLFAAAGLSGMTYLMCVALPRENALIASMTCVPVLRNAQVGEKVFLGRYEQDNDLSDGAEPIEWIVLAREGGRMLLISKYALDCVPFNAADGLTSWDYCSIRLWLNDEFYDSAFTAPEQTVSLVSHIAADRNALFDTDPGKPTKSRVFLLSTVEADAYFHSDAERRCEPTAYAKARGAKTDDGGCMWWLRTPGYDGTAAARVLQSGDVSLVGQPAQRSLAVRPAMWVVCEDGAAA